MGELEMFRMAFIRVEFSFAENAAAHVQLNLNITN